MNTKSARPGKQAPISAHPAFPAVVALWFAALLGLGCLVVPSVLFEWLFAASEPLGMTARLIVALTAAALGAGIGLFLARKVALAGGETLAPRQRMSTPSAQQRYEPTEPKRPISAREELGSESFDQPVSQSLTAGSARLPGRRRALSVANECERSELFEAAPLPGGQASFDDAAIAAFSREAEEALDLSDFAAQPELDTGENCDPLPLPGSDLEEEFAPAVLEATLDQPAASNPLATDARIETDLSLDPHEDHSAMNTDHPHEAESAYNPLSDHISSGPVPVPAYHLQQPMAQPAPASFSAQTQVAAPPPAPGLEELRMVELVDRFARAMQQSAASQLAPAEIAAGVPETASLSPMPPLVFRRQGLGEAASPYDSVQPASGDAAAEVAVSSAMAMPSALRPMALHDFDHDDHEADDEAETFNLRFPAPAVPPPQFQAPDLSENLAEPDDDSEAYPSLLSMKGRFAAPQPTVRIDDVDASESLQPVVVFPGHENRRAEPASDGPTRDPLAPQMHTFAHPAPALRPFDGPAQGPVAGASRASPASPGDTEKALREALEKLQRMSGTR